MSDFIGDLRRDLENRLKEVDRELAGVEPLMRERERLQAALALPPFAAQSRGGRGEVPKGTSPRKARTRAPRGANREAILTVVAERPGTTAAEISDVTKISRAVTYNTLAKLVEAGKVEKTDLPGGQIGYKPATPADSQPGL